MYRCSCGLSIGCESQFDEHFKLRHIDPSGYHLCQVCIKKYKYFKSLKDHYLKNHKAEIKDVLFPAGTPYLKGDAEIAFRINQNLPRSRKTANFIRIEGTNILHLQINNPIETVQPQHEVLDYDFLNDVDFEPDEPQSQPNPLNSQLLERLEQPVNETFEGPELDDQTAAGLQAAFEEEIDNFEYHLSSSQQSTYDGTKLGKDYLDLLSSLRLEHPEIPMNFVKTAADKFTDFFAERTNLDSEYSKEFKRIANSSYLIKKNTPRCISICQKEVRNQETLKAYYASIQEILAQFLGCSKLVDQLVKEKERTKRPDLFLNINDIKYIQQIQRMLDEKHPAKNHYVATFKLSYDDINMSFNKKYNTKLTMVYLQINNIHYRFQTKRDTFALVGIAKRKTVDKLTFKGFMKPLCDQLNALKPIKVADKYFHPLFFAANSDNLGLNEGQGITTSFISDCCRYCVATYTEFNSNFCLDEFLQESYHRTPEESDHAFSEVNRLLPNCLFPIDIYHDLVFGNYEFVFDPILRECPDLFCFKNSLNLVKGLLKSKDSLHEFDFFKSQNGSFGFRGTGHQRQVFFDLFPLVNTFLSTDEQEFELYCMLRDISNFCFNDSIYMNDLALFEQLVKKFILSFHAVFPKQPIKPKMHNLLHYARLIPELGPLLYHNQQPAERCHQKAKRILDSVRSFVSLEATISGVFQSNLEGAFEEEEKVKVHCKSWSEVDVEFRELIGCDVNAECELKELSFVTVDSIRIEADAIYLYRHQTQNSDLPLFVKILKIFKYSGELYFVARLIKTKFFNKKLYAYAIEHDSQVRLFNVKQLVHHHDLLHFARKHSDDDYTYINKTFHIPFQIFYRYRDVPLSFNLD